jgi:hypothetical protein
MNIFMITKHINNLFSAGYKVNERAATLSLLVLYIDVVVIMDYCIEERHEDRVQKRYFMFKEFDGSIQRTRYAGNLEGWFYTS